MSLATNAALNNTLSKPRYLRVDREDVPLDKQVATSMQEYTGAGAETITFSGDARFMINTAVAGALTVEMAAEDMRNLVGKSIDVCLTGVHLDTVTFTLPGGAIFASDNYGAADGLNTFAVAAATSFAHRFVFMSVGVVAVI